MGIDHVEGFNIGAAGSMNNTSKFRYIDDILSIMFAAEKVRGVALNWHSIQYHELFGQHSRELLKLFPTFFTGHACILLQFKILQVEGITVVSERHPRPLSQSVGALA